MLLLGDMYKLVSVYCFCLILCVWFRMATYFSKSLRNLDACSKSVLLLLCFEMRLLDGVIIFSLYFYTAMFTILSTASPDVSFPSSVARLEALGHDIGYRLVEKVAISKPLGRGALEDIKFICQHFWMEIFGKQVGIVEEDEAINHLCIYR